MNRPAHTSQHTATRAANSSPATSRPTADPIAHTEMAAAIGAGTAQTLSRTITDIARYQGQWWLYDRDEWILADDDQLVADLDAAAALMADVDQQVIGARRTH